MLKYQRELYILTKLEKVKRECNQAYDCGLSDGETKANETYSENTGAMARINDLEEKLDAMTEARDYYQEKIHQAQDKYNKAYNNGYAAAEVDYKGFNDVSVTVNGERYNII